MGFSRGYLCWVISRLWVMRGETETCGRCSTGIIDYVGVTTVTQAQHPYQRRVQYGDQHRAKHPRPTPESNTNETTRGVENSDRMQTSHDNSNHQVKEMHKQTKYVEAFTMSNRTWLARLMGCNGSRASKTKLLAICPLAWNECLIDHSQQGHQGI
jgi:hypothetical protein